LVLLSLAFWGLVWGVPGMILSTPLTVALKIVLENMETTRPIARLCSNVRSFR
jgi:AI-2 transport protein TqsA